MSISSGPELAENSYFLLPKTTHAEERSIKECTPESNSTRIQNKMQLMGSTNPHSRVTLQKQIPHPFSSCSLHSNGLFDSAYGWRALGMLEKTHSSALTSHLGHGPSGAPTPAREEHIKGTSIPMQVEQWKGAGSLSNSRYLACSNPSLPTSPPPPC